jgi:hypothetical protein
MVLHYDLVVAFMIIIPKVVFILLTSLDLLSSNTQVVDLRIVKNLTLLKLSQALGKTLKSFGWGKRKLDIFHARCFSEGRIA